MHRGSSSRASRLVVALVALLAVNLAAVPVAEGGTVKRTWSASIGSSGANGASKIYGYTNGTGFLVTNLKGLGAARTWSVGIHRGTCANLGSRILSFPSVKSAANGTATANHALDTTRMAAVWKATWNAGAVAIRLVSGAAVRCGTYRFPVATRVVVGGLGIDLAVIRGPRTGLPCNVAMYGRELAQPGEYRVTLLYAHARRGMFLPLLKASRVDNGASLIGRTVRVYTSSSKYYTNRITEVRRRQTSSQSAFGVTSSKVLWLQTSEGPYTTTHKASHPKPRPFSC